MMGRNGGPISTGMGNIPDEVLGDRARKMADIDRLDEPTIVHRLAGDYGGELIRNALRVFKSLHPLDEGENGLLARG